MNKQFLRYFSQGLIGLFFVLLVFPLAYVEAHEVYVLDTGEIQTALEQPHSDFIGVINDHLGQFVLSGIVAMALVGAVFFIGTRPFIEQSLDPALHKIKHYAPAIAQFTFGLALLASGIYGASFGPELPMSEEFGSYASIIQILFVVLGACIMGGIYPRIAGTIALVTFIPMVVQYKFYMLNYGIYFGEALALSLFGGGYALFAVQVPAFEKNIERHLHKYKFLLLRIVFGLSLIFASVYAKYVYGALALETILKYNLTDYFPFDPSFIVLGACITEILIGLFYLIGFEVRFTSLVFLKFLILSILFFGESVWPHIILIGTAVAMFTHGYDHYTLGARLSSRKDLEPVL